MEPLTQEEVLECNRDQMIEMDIHKWIESEKAGKDVGKAAYGDWIRRFAEGWRRAWMERRAQRLRSHSVSPQT